jgi:hypothetical protein
MSDEDNTTQDEDVEAHKMHRADTKADLKADAANTEEPPDVEGHVLDPGRHDVGRHDHGKTEA